MGYEQQNFIASGLTDSSESVSFRADFICYRYCEITTCLRISNKAEFTLLILDFITITKAEGKVDFEHAEAVDLIQSAEFFERQILDPVRPLRAANVVAHELGHLFIIGGSAYMPGALLMAVQAAVRSGADLVTAFTPTSIASSLQRNC